MAALAWYINQLRQLFYHYYSPIRYRWGRAQG